MEGSTALIRQLQRSLSTENPKAMTADCPVSKGERNAVVGGVEVRGRKGDKGVARGMEMGIGTEAGPILGVGESK
jgi:hypothetical protein